jgi:hypothetical protein
LGKSIQTIKEKDMPVALLNEIILMSVGAILGYKTGKFIESKKSKIVDVANKLKNKEEK